MKRNIDKRQIRHKRVRAKIFGIISRPRFSVFRSNKEVVLQLIDDENKRTLVYVSSKGLKGKTKSDRAKEAGLLLAEKALLKKIENVVFDRGGYGFTGRVRAVAEGAKSGGLKF